MNRIHLPFVLLIFSLVAFTIQGLAQSGDPKTKNLPKLHAHVSGSDHPEFQKRNADPYLSNPKLTSIPGSQNGPVLSGYASNKPSLEDQIFSLERKRASVPENLADDYRGFILRMDAEIQNRRNLLLIRNSFRTFFR